MVADYAGNNGATTDVVTSAQSGELNLYDNLECWMTRLPPKLRALPIVQLAIPGSHNSMTYTIKRDDEVGPDESEVIRSLSRHFPRLVKSIIFNWSVNQDDNIKEQLNGGIRYLDLRVATKGREGKIYFLHGLYGAEISQPLQEVVEWLSAHPNEVIIVDFQHFYSFNEADHKNLIDQIKYIFRGKMYPVYGKIENVSLQWLNLEKYQIFVIYRNVAARNHNNLWPSGIWPTPWPNTVSASKLINFLNEGLQKRSRDIGFVSQCLMTPNSSYITKHLCGNLKQDLFPKCRKASLPWIKENFPGSGGMNIVITDFISSDDFLFPKTVIQRNTTLLGF